MSGFVIRLNLPNSGEVFRTSSGNWVFPIRFDTAEVFPTAEEAKGVIDTMPRVYDRDLYSVEGV